MGVFRRRDDVKSWYWADLSSNRGSLRKLCLRLLSFSCVCVSLSSSYRFDLLGFAIAGCLLTGHAILEHPFDRWRRQSVAVCGSRWTDDAHGSVAVQHAEQSGSLVLRAVACFSLSRVCAVVFHGWISRPRQRPLRHQRRSCTRSLSLSASTCLSLFFTLPTLLVCRIQPITQQLATVMACVWTTTTTCSCSEALILI